MPSAQNLVKTSGTKRPWVLLVRALFLIALSSEIAFVRGENSWEKLSEEEVLRKYPGFFRTEAEQTALEARLEKNSKSNSPASGKETPNQEKCHFSCDRTTPSTTGTSPSLLSSNYNNRHLLDFLPKHSASSAAPFRRRHSNGRSEPRERGELEPPYYHACCISRRKFICPDEAVDMDGNRVQLAQFGGRNQYFLSQTCSHAEGCTGCGCDLEHTPMPAVMRKNDTFCFGFVMLPGCCKCFNGSPPS